MTLGMSQLIVVQGYLPSVSLDIILGIINMRDERIRKDMPLKCTLVMRLEHV